MHFPSFLKAQGGSSSHHMREEISIQKWCSSQPTYLNGLPYIGGLSSHRILRKALKVKRPRFDVSLVYLTRKFMDLVKSAPGSILKQVCNKTGSTQTVYDITVLKLTWLKRSLRTIFDG